MKRAPVTVMTDGDLAFQSAVKNVYPGVLGVVGGIVQVY